MMRDCDNCSRAGECDRSMREEQTTDEMTDEMTMRGLMNELMT